jgi:hypothetical protein
MGLSDPQVREQLSEARWLQYKHESEKQGWSAWERFLHRFKSCPICKKARADRQQGKANGARSDVT